jgi:thiamine biosynthesis lipoprotein
MIVDGVRYGHILDPRTGWPVRGLASVTVVASHCLVAGTLTTMAMLKGERGAAWLEASGAHCLWVAEDGRTGGSLAATRAPAERSAPALTRALRPAPGSPATEPR